MDVKNTLTRTCGKVKLQAIKHSPEILLAAGIISGAAALVFAVKETLKAEEVLDNHTRKMNEITGARDLATTTEEVDYTEEDAKKDKVKAYMQTGWEFAKLYAPTFVFASLSLTCILTSHGIMRKRNLALAATMATVQKAFDEYRERVIRDLGKEKDEHFLYDTIEKGTEVKTVDDKGKEKTKIEKYPAPTKTSVYGRFFDEANDNFEKDGCANYRFVRSQMIYLQHKLIANGYLFLNDVYKALGFPITIAGQSAGWIYDYNNRNNTIIKFRGFDIDEVNNSPEVMAFMNGYERNCLIDFENIRNDILTDIQLVDSSVDVI